MTTAVRTTTEIMAEMRNVLADAEGRSLSDEEAQKYEGLETELATVRRDSQIRSRQKAYDTPTNDAIRTADVKDLDEQSRAFAHYLRTGEKNHDLIEARAQGTTPDTAGGYLVPPTFLQRLVEVRKKIGGFAALAEEITTETGSTLEFPSIDDTANSGGITAEGAALTSGADLVFGTVNLGSYKYTAAGGGANLPLKVNVELLQDAGFDVESKVAQFLGIRISRAQAPHWTTGSGTGQPFGVAHAGLTADVILAAGSPLTYAKFLDMEEALDEEYLQNAVHVMRAATWSAWREIVDTAGRPLILPQAQSGIGGPVPKQLGGYPVVIDNTMPAIGINAHLQVFGDFREAYLIRRVSNLAIVVDPYSYGKEGQVAFHAWERADGNIQNRKAYVVLKGGAT